MDMHVGLRKYFQMWLSLTKNRSNLTNTQHSLAHPPTHPLSSEPLHREARCRSTSPTRFPRTRTCGTQRAGYGESWSDGVCYSLLNGDGSIMFVSIVTSRLMMSSEDEWGSRLAFGLW